MFSKETDADVERRKQLAYAPLTRDSVSNLHSLVMILAQRLFADPDLLMKQLLMPIRPPWSYDMKKVLLPITVCISVQLLDAGRSGETRRGNVVCVAQQPIRSVSSGAIELFRTQPGGMGRACGIPF